MNRETKQKSTYGIAAWLFLRCLGIFYAIAFVSLGTQVLGLMGSHGILPVGDYLENIRSHVAAPSCYWQWPTLFWLDASDWWLQFSCWAGAVLAVLLVFDFFPLAMLAAMWALYLSLCVAGQTFLSFQWDSLLLEAGFLALFVAPRHILPNIGRTQAPSAGSVFLFRWLAFRLFFTSGAVKLLSLDPTWRNLTALQYHFQTQPLPHQLSWWANQLPHGALKLMTIGMFVIELLIPFFIFSGRKPRLIAFSAFLLLQVTIGLTGNYNFFNLLSAGVCLFLLDDQALEIFRKWIQNEEKKANPAAKAFFFFPVFFLVISLTYAQMAMRLNALLPIPASMRKVLKVAAPFRTLNSYGLFAVMTTRRREIVIQGSWDAKEWQDYAFKFKPGDPGQAPKWSQPHQPRLDWQMWFAALGSYQNNPWFLKLVERLLEGEESVTRLLAGNPFEKRPPTYVRAIISDYAFTSLAERRATGLWWKRENEKTYLNPAQIPAWGRVAP